MTDYCRHLTKCADAACSYRMVAREAAAAERARLAETAPDVPMSPDKGHAETAPEGDPPCPTCGHPMTVHDVNEGWICKRHPRIAETAPEEGS